VDAAEGRFSVGYFDAHDPNDMRVAMFEDGRDEVTVKLGGDGDRTSVRIAVADVQRTFLLDDRAFAVDLTLLDGERIVSGLLDESGHFLVLIFNEAADRFYYVRNPAFPAPEVMVEETVGPHVLRFGERSRFCFLVHPATGREILIAVHADQIRRNTWYDGPFDQVPPRLSIGDLVRRAYPYVEDAGGVDEHGVFLERPDSRIAISPYIAYESGPRLIAELATRLVVGPGPEAWLGAVEERKNTWRATDAEGTGAGPPPSAPRRHESLRSRTWPPNHWAASSRTWPAEHDGPRSTSWAPNRMVEESREPPPSTPR